MPDPAVPLDVNTVPTLISIAVPVEPVEAIGPAVKTVPTALLGAPAVVKSVPSVTI